MHTIALYLPPIVGADDDFNSFSAGNTYETKEEMVKIEFLDRLRDKETDFEEIFFLNIFLPYQMVKSQNYAGRRDITREGQLWS